MPREDDFQKLPSASFNKEEWRAAYATDGNTKPLGEHHDRVWTWFDELVPGERPPALIECWSRGHGKSTTVENNIARCGATGNRRFWMYVCATQDAANKHVQSIARTLGRMGVERAISKFGFSLGWRGDLLRTANGFNVLAFGLDGGSRGVKLDNLRPDGIALDDIDDRHDSVAVAQKRFEIISETVIPSGADDCAYIFVQNAIHAYSVMSLTISGENGILRNRVPTVPIPAIYDMKYREVFNEDGKGMFEIYQGTASWVGKPISQCQAEMNDEGPTAFLRECQHETGVGGKFFPEYISALPGQESLHEVFSFEIPGWWPKWAGFDWGKRSPAASYLLTEDPLGNVFVIDEWYKAGASDDEHIAGIEEMFARNGVMVPTTPIFGDPSIFPPKENIERIGAYTVEKYWDAGLRMMPANNDRVNGWNKIKEALRKRTQLDNPMDSSTFIRSGLTVFLDRCPNLCRTMPKMVPSKSNAEDMDTTLEDHGPDALRYGMFRDKTMIALLKTAAMDPSILIMSGSARYAN